MCRTDVFLSQDEECLRPGDASDFTFLEKLEDTVGGHPHFVTSVQSPSLPAGSKKAVAASISEAVINQLLLRLCFPSSHKLADAKTRKIMGREEFRLLHYAGEVNYNVNGVCILLQI